MFRQALRDILVISLVLMAGYYGVYLIVNSTVAEIRRCKLSLSGPQCTEESPNGN